MNDRDPSKQRAQDSFWSLDEITPKKHLHDHHVITDTEPVLIESENAATSRPSDTVEPVQVPPQRIVPRSSPHELPPPEVYTPEHPLLRRVKICTWPSRYTFYENFRSDAIRYVAEAGQEAQYVPFFSYMPQYVQMSAEQRAYYFWWRENLRNGKCLRVDSSYLFLYIYEILNLPDVIPPEQGLRQLCFLWTSYRAQYEILDRYLSEWVCDYCLIHHLTLPDDLLSPIFGYALHAATFREFYLSGEHDPDALFASVLINFVSPYQYRTGKYYTDEHASLFTKHTEGAVRAVIARYRSAGKAFPHRGDFPVPSHISRDSYSGSICAYNIKKHIEVDFYSCSGSAELRMLAADMIKCIENYLRGMIGVKSRFSIRALPAEMKEYIAAYFAPYLPEKPKKAAVSVSNTEPDYMKQYEAPGGDFSPASAYQIERDAWDVTDRLTSAFIEEPPISPIPDPPLSPKAEDAPPPVTVTEDKGSTPDYLRVAAALLLSADRAGFVALADQHALLPDTLAEQINDACYETVGDIVIEDTGDGYTVIECYREDLEEWIHA